MNRPIGSNSTQLFPNVLFFYEVERLLRQNLSVILRVQGGSMRPFLREGDTVRLVPFVTERLQRWDIVLAQTTFGVLLHRVVSIRNNRILLAGDANRRLEETDSKHIIGIVDAAWRRETPLNTQTIPLLVLWYGLRPFRGYLLCIYERLQWLRNVIKHN